MRVGASWAQRNWGVEVVNPTPDPPVNTTAPFASVAGTGAVGDVCSCTNGNWSNAPTSYAYQWRRGGTNIGGATAATHTIVVADSGTALTCLVTASNSGGNASSASNAINATLRA
jgi:hypothetical protein